MNEAEIRAALDELRAENQRLNRLYTRTRAELNALRRALPPNPPGWAPEPEPCPEAMESTSKSPRVAVAGIDVGGTRKGFHAVAITNGDCSGHFMTKDATEIARWCRETARARVIAVDAPCRWSKDGRARPAERQLMRRGISCFSTPTRQRALDHPLNHFGWMLQGEALFRALEHTHRLCRQLPSTDGENLCVETFPHAIAWHMTDGRAEASRKGEQRRALLKEAGIDIANLTNIDLVDAALCALVAHRVATREKCVTYGEPDTGLIVVPASE